MRRLGLLAAVLGCSSTVPEDRTVAEPQAAAPEPEPEAPVPPEQTTEPLRPEATPPPAKVVAEPEPPPPEACLAPVATLPAALPDDGRRCLQGLIAARERYAFVEPPSAESTPCAVESVEDDGTVYRRGQVRQPDSSKQLVVYDEIDEDDQRTVMTRTVHFDGKGREVRRDEVWDQYLEGESTPDCSNTSTTRHKLDGRGWPKQSTEVIDSCEGVDAGAIVTKRRFTKHEGTATAKEAIVDRGTKLRSSAWWMPDPAAPLAFGRTDHYGDVDCWLEVRSCKGTVLGRLHGRKDGDVHGAQRYVWTCEPP